MSSLITISSLDLIDSKPTKKSKILKKVKVIQKITDFPEYYITNSIILIEGKMVLKVIPKHRVEDKTKWINKFDIKLDKITDEFAFYKICEY